MARRTVDLLPEIFRTDTNKKFLSATLDQLVQEPVIKQTQGYVGRRVGPGVNPADNYVQEPTATRADYQLEPGVIFLKPDTNTVEDAITYPGMIDALNLEGAQTQLQDRLWESQYYTFDPFVDWDKFSNYSQYYWLPEGPDSVDVASSVVPLSDDFTVTRSNAAYTFSDVAGTNPIITLARGGNYTFAVSQPGHNFWIQAAPGFNGTMPGTPNISSRDVFGVTNNGEDTGTVTFDVPQITAQDFYLGLTSAGTADLLTDLKFNQLNNIYVSTFLQQYPSGIDGITNLNGRTVIFSNNTLDPEAGGWQITTQFDPLEPGVGNNGLPGSYDSLLFDQTTDITSLDTRYSVWLITYVLDNDGEPYMNLAPIQTVPLLNKLQITFGAQWSNTSWFRNSDGFYEQIPLITAILNTLYYQDSTNPEIFGIIKLVDTPTNNPIDINEIVGAKTYTSPNGVTFTNGLKVQFRGLTVPASYQDLEYYVEGVGTGPGTTERIGFIDGEAYFGLWHVFNGQKTTGSFRDTTVFQQFIYDDVETSLLNYGAGGPAGAPLPINSQAGATEGNGIRLIPVSKFVTPETYTQSLQNPYDFLPYDVGGYDETLDAPLIPDYLTMNRASQDLNAWARSNRWFHIDVINYSAEINNTVPVLDNNFRAKRPILEFRANLKLFNSGTQAQIPVNIIDFNATDALSNINGQIGYGTDGYIFTNGSRVIFAADSNPQVRNKVYEVQFINPDGDINSPDVINLVPAFRGDAQIGDLVVSLSGVNQQGKSFWYDGEDWIQAQEKISVNQAPLFDVYDASGVSLGNSAVYPSTNFAGSKLFGYALGTTQINDAVLGVPLRFLNINNVGDIVFQNYFYTDQFTFVQDNVGQSEPISFGFARQYIDRVTFSNLIGWQTAEAENRSRQVFRFNYSGDPLVLDIPVASDTIYPPIQIYINGIFVDPTKYTFSVTSTNTTVTLSNPPVNGSVIEVLVISDQSSQVGFYQVPLNLENNALNRNSDVFTLGTLRQHYESIAQNLRNIQGPVNGANNTRDLGNIVPYGENIVQNSAPLTLAGVFLRDPEFNIFSSLTFNSQEYSKYKAKLIDLVTQNNVVNLTSTQVLDLVMQEISFTRNESMPFYWSDMIPAGETYTENTYLYTPISTPVFDTIQTYNFDSANFKGLLVYLNGSLLTLNYDYIVSDGTPTLTITVPLAVGDVIVIREYPTTYGSYIPNTPTKLGLYPAYKPEIYVDEAYVTPTLVIRGHDGSITVAYGDIRDSVLLEFETRIFNNLKVSSNIPLTLAEVMPGQFRTTDYTLAEINQILSEDFLSWIGWNKLDYVTQTYINNNPFTYNYSQSSDKLNSQPLLGAWRGIYNYFYDTITPNTTPWEMLGFSQEPDWWQTEYGPAPYTSGNLVLWEDLEAGLVRDPAGFYVLPQYRRPGLTSAIPSGTEGQLLAPLDSVVGNYNQPSFRRSWTFGDDGPTESAWRTSSSWPFAVMRLLALTRPAKFFSLFVDRDRYKFDEDLDQYLWDSRYRLDASNLAPLYGQGESRASFIDWIIDYNQQLGTDATERLERVLANVDTRLCWRMAAFSDKRYLKIYTERSTPTSENAGLLLPDESYQLLLYDNQAFEQATYSSVIIQSTEDGWAVLGYNPATPYFEILVSRPNGLTRELTAGNVSARVPVQYSDNVARIPYGYVFTNQNAVCDFLISYGELLSRQGWAFEGIENGYIMDWNQMAQEFLYWSGQGWITGSLINLNPGATSVSVTKPGAVAESLLPARLDNLILNQNRAPFKAAELCIDRLENTFKVTSQNQNTINYLNLKFTAWEHLIVFENRSIFNDLIYDPVTGARQSRVLVNGSLSGAWNGTVNAPGFILNQNNIVEWSGKKIYTKGEIVIFKGEYWAASTIIQPSEEFNYGLWLKSDYDQVMKGLLPNAANASDELSGAYSVYSANLEQDVDLFSYGLIGFRPREYMQALNLDDVSQVQLYQQFLGTKGTKRALEQFNLADLGKEVAEYKIYELWAMLQSSYGATANRSYFELLMNEALLTSDPSLMQVILPTEVSQADQTVLVNDIWKSSYKITSPDILPTLDAPLTDISFPNAGYVNLNDVDITVFSLDDPTELENNLEEIGVGTTVWVAKSSSYDWNVYRCKRVPGEINEVTNNLDGLSLVKFTQEHGLSAGDYLIIRYFNDAINGVYRVNNVPSVNTVLIEYTFSGNQNSVTGTGVGFTLDSIRVAQASDVANLSYAKQIRPGAKVWVDNNGQGLWQVIEKTDPYVLETSLETQFNVGNGNFGQSIGQGLNNLTALIGAPGFVIESPAAYNNGTAYVVDDIVTYNGIIYSCINDSTGNLPSNTTYWSIGAPGAVYPFFRNDLNEYEQQQPIQLTATGVSSLGATIDVGDQNWAIVGAPASNNNQGYALSLYRGPGSDIVAQSQLFVSPDLDFNANQFGHAVAISLDEHLMYIGAPGANKVYAYARVDTQFQRIEYITDGISTVYNYSSAIKLTSPATSYPEQLVVALGNQNLVYGVDWNISNTNIVLSTVPAVGLTLRITRRDSYQLDQQSYFNVPQSETSGSGTGVLFTVNRLRGTFTVAVTDGGSDYSVGDTITIAGDVIGSGTRLATTMIDGTSYVIVSAGDTDFTLHGAADNNPGTIFVASGTPAIGTGTVAENLVLTLTQTGPTYSGALTAGLSTLSLNSVDGLAVGQSLTVISGSGTFAPGTTITGIVGLTVQLSDAITASGFTQFYAEPSSVNQFTQTGSGVDNTAVFALKPYLATVETIDSFAVTVNGKIYRPGQDYTYDLSLHEITFVTVPAPGTAILVRAQSYYQYFDTIEIPSVTTTYTSDSGNVLSVTSTSGIVSGMIVSGTGYSEDQYVISVDSATQVTLNSAKDTGSVPSGSLTFALGNFGHSINTTTDGAQFIIGCTGGSKSPGQAYLYDRNTQTFVFQPTSTSVFTTEQNLTAPVTVQVNGEFLVDSEYNFGNTFTVTGANQVTVNVPLTVGDEIKIGVNSVALVQVIESETENSGAQFGYTVEQCVNDCSLFIGAPYDDTLAPESGMVGYYINQSRVYGTITTNIANPTLTAGDTIRINDIVVELYSTNISGNAQPATVESLVVDINNAQNINLSNNPDPAVQARYRGLSNVVASTTPDLEIISDGTSIVYDVGNIYSSLEAYTPIVYVNDVLQTLGGDYTYNNSTEQITFVVAPQGANVIRVVSGRLVLSVINRQASAPGEYLTVEPSTGTMWNDLGINTYAWQQNILAPVAQDFAHFGESIYIGTSSDSLVVGAPNASMILPEEFDNGTTTFDADSTEFSSSIANSGAVYIYDRLDSANSSVNNPALFVFGQQIIDNSLSTLDQFGKAVDLTTGTLLVGIPGANNNIGLVSQLVNETQGPAWQVQRTQTPVVDIRNMNTVFMYDRVSGAPKQYFDFFDPLQGRLLGVVRQNLDYIGAVDPAQYNVGETNNRGQRWGEDHIGEIWWDVALARFIDPNQDDIVYASRRWGQLFPGSRVMIYQWVSSPVPPSEYAGPGVPRSLTSYTINTSLTAEGVFVDVYYFWVSGNRTVERSTGKTLSATTVAQYIESPRSSGISYIAPINSGTIAIYNGLEYISAQDTVIHVEFDQQLNDAAIHVQYQLIPENRADGFLSDTLYRKLLDSFCGVDTLGNLVPDPLLPPSERYGIEFRPRQSMFINRFLALKNYLGRTNAIIAQYPIIENRTSLLLNSAEPEPSIASGAWDKRVANYEELTYQDLSAVSLGYKYLVVSDATNNGLWTIYETVPDTVVGSKTLQLIRVQNYDTRKYWFHIDWYEPGYDPFTRIAAEVAVFNDLDTITVPDGSVVKVTTNGQGKWELYRLTLGTWIRVALEDGTIQFEAKLWDYSIGRYGFDSEVFDAQYFDQEPSIETRKILEAINQELLIGDLLIERNRLLILMFNYILSEQQAPLWLTKTSLIDVDHTIRSLEPFQIYRADNQDFVLNYIQEVKPYHTQIREFNLIYNGFDVYQGTLTDFDVPAYWNAAEDLFISPVLDNTGTLSTTSSTPSNNPIWQTFPYNQWYQNYLLEVTSVNVINGGSGYVDVPTVIVTGGNPVFPAVLTAQINTAGQVAGIIIVDPGQGYSTTPVITFVGGGGTGARAVVYIDNQLIRNINTTIKYDRYQYNSDIVEWQPNVIYTDGSRVRFDNRVWAADGTITSAEFDPQDWTFVPAGSLSGVDRTIGYYTPFVNEPGLDLDLLMTGIDYPGVQVDAPDFNQNTGYDVGNYDINPYDNISFGPEGLPTYDPAILDAIYESYFGTPATGPIPTGTALTDINVDGGAFIDTYSSHAPEELVPGSMFDTLDMRVFTTPGADWEDIGHGMPLQQRRFVYSGTDTLSFGNLVDYPVAIKVYNLTLGLMLGQNQIDGYTINWVDYTFTLTGAGSGLLNVGDIVTVDAYGLGGGDQLFNNSYLGNVIQDTIIIPRAYSVSNEYVIFVNGVLTTAFTASAIGDYNTEIVFPSVYGSGDRITVSVIGPSFDSFTRSWSAPVTQYLIADGGLNVVLDPSIQNATSTNPVNLIVTRNGLRARPSEVANYIGDGSTIEYLLPQNGGYSQSLIANNDVSVYVNNFALTLGTDFTVTPYDGINPRAVQLTFTPVIGVEILVAVRTAAQYWVTGDLLTFRPSAGLNPQVGDQISITSWNDTREQNLITRTFVGPTTSGVQITEPYDDTLFDEGNVTGASGSFDFAVGTVLTTNTFNLGKIIENPTRLVVSLDGEFLFSNDEFLIEGENLVIPGPAIGATQVVVVTEMTNNVVPGEIAFRIFQDMRGLQSTYRITPATTTDVAQPLSATSDVIYVGNASHLSEPDLVNNIFGLITINGERIAYRERDTILNTISGLIRGTAGTAAAAHDVGTPVYDIGIGNLLPTEYQNKLVYNNFLGDGSTTAFTAENVTESDADTILVYVGGIKQTSGYTVTAFAPVVVDFDNAPTAGYQVTIGVERGLSWYAPGSGTASNGVPLQEQETAAARFIRGDI